jgi:hypothetical protein
MLNKKESYISYRQSHSFRENLKNGQKNVKKIFFKMKKYIFLSNQSKYNVDVNTKNEAPFMLNKKGHVIFYRQSHRLVDILENVSLVLFQPPSWILTISHFARHCNFLYVD